MRGHNYIFHPGGYVFYNLMYVYVHISNYTFIKTKFLEPDFKVNIVNPLFLIVF